MTTTLLTKISHTRYSPREFTIFSGRTTAKEDVVLRSTRSDLSGGEITGIVIGVLVFIIICCVCGSKVSKTNKESGHYEDRLAKVRVWVAD